MTGLIFISVMPNSGYFNETKAVSYYLIEIKF